MSGPGGGGVARRAVRYIGIGRGEDESKEGGGFHLQGPFWKKKEKKVLCAEDGSFPCLSFGLFSRHRTPDRRVSLDAILGYKYDSIEIIHQ